MSQQDWLRDWLPAPHRLNTRRQEPDILESAAVAAAASQFAAAVIRMAQEARTDGENEAEPRNTAMNLAAWAAVVEHQVSEIEAYIQMEENLDSEEDDPSPEAVRAREEIRNARAASDALGQLARTDMEELGMPLSRKTDLPWEERNIEEENRQYQAIRFQARAAATIGNAAALNWLLDRLEEEKDQEEHDHERTSALVLAMWPNEQELITGNILELPPEAARVRKETIDRVMDMVWDIEEHRPVFVTELTQDEWENGNAQDALSNLNPGPETNPHFEWEPENPEDAIITYRYQGSTHVKRLGETYDHPIEIREALYHCNELENLILELYDGEEPEGEETRAHRHLLKMAAANRAMALTNIHNADWERSEHAVRIAIEHGGATRARELIRAFYNEQEQAVSDALARHALLDPPLKEGELRAAMDAARAAGAPEETLRHMASMLGVTPEGARRLGIPEREPVPWKEARRIIMHLCATDPPVSREKWDRIAAATGWPADSPEVAKLRTIMTTWE